MSVAKTCEVCGRGFRVKPGLKDKRRFCGHACASRARARPGMTRICPKCGGPKSARSKTCWSCVVWVSPNLGLKGPAHHAWRGGRSLDREGYVRTHDSTHPWPRKGGGIREHVRVMELHLGRRIRPDEVVHHKDHDRTNNALANLELMDRIEHARHHQRVRPPRSARITAACLHCGSEYTPHRPNRGQRYCSQRCWGRAREAA